MKKATKTRIVYGKLYFCKIKLKYNNKNINDSRILKEEIKNHYILVSKSLNEKVNSNIK